MTLLLHLRMRVWKMEQKSMGCPNVCHEQNPRRVLHHVGEVGVGDEEDQSSVSVRRHLLLCKNLESHYLSRLKNGDDQEPL